MEKILSHPELPIGEDQIETKDDDPRGIAQMICQFENDV